MVSVTETVSRGGPQKAPPGAHFKGCNTYPWAKSCPCLAHTGALFKLWIAGLVALLLCLAKGGQFLHHRKISQTLWVWWPKADAALCDSQRLMTSVPNKAIKITKEDSRLALPVSVESLILTDTEAIWIPLPDQIYPSHISVTVPMARHT